MKVLFLILFSTPVFANQFNFKEVHVKSGEVLKNVVMVLKDNTHFVYHKGRLLPEKYVVKSCKLGFCLVELDRFCNRR